MRPFKVCLIFLFSLACGCMTAPNKAPNYGAILQNTHGTNINEIVDRIGYPTRSFVAPNGNMVYVYETHSTGTSYKWTTPRHSQTTFVGDYAFTTETGGQTFGGNQRYFWCKTYFEVNTSSVVVNTKFEGNDCY